MKNIGGQRSGLPREGAFTDSEVPKGPLAPTFPSYHPTCMSPCACVLVRVHHAAFNAEHKRGYGKCRLHGQLAFYIPR